ncbi:MAG TPA: hypothetical protein VHM26_14280 [Chitinophagaceae bacterium]|jgi:hypothetical protein|nr:hypothetical protein [Chitinophagaceae bacterium]
MSNLFNFIEGGWFFRCIGAAWRRLFSKEKYAELLKEELSENYGKMILLIFLLIFVAIAAAFGF